MKERWRESKVSEDATHHVCRGVPAYQERFHEVLKFHDPGLAPVVDDSGAFHIDPDGQPAYEARHIRTFGFYEGRAAVHSYDGWLHVLPDGSPLYEEGYEWCGNFQDGRCTVRDSDGSYFHLHVDGTHAYRERYRYAGDFRDGYAVVQRDDGRHTHIDFEGRTLHGRWFRDLDVFHKGYARACDDEGWHHVDTSGKPIYKQRFRDVEPFYNGQSRVERIDGSLAVIDESGHTMLELSRPPRSDLERLSSEMVGLWRTQTIRAAVELEVLECLPATAAEVERLAGMHSSTGVRLMRALMELGLVTEHADDNYRATELGSFLLKGHPFSLSDAALHWGRESYAAWSGITEALVTGKSHFERGYGRDFFAWIQDKPADLNAYHRAMASYARHDYGELAKAVDFSVHMSVLDAGGGTGELAFALLRTNPGLEATVMDRLEVVATSVTPEDLRGRCRFIQGDLLQKWPVYSDAVILARVVHDRPDPDALTILRRAREAMSRGNMLYVVEMVLDEETGSGGLLDLNMLVMTGGAERTEKQFRCMLDEACFELLDVIETRSVNSVIRARAK